MSKTTISAIAILTALIGVGCQQEKKPAEVLTPRPEPQTQAQATTAIPKDTSGKVIVHIVSRNQTITVKSGDHGVVYSIRDAKGNLMLADATPQQLEQYDPQLFRQLRNYIAVQADASEAIESSSVEPVWAGDASAAR